MTLDFSKIRWCGTYAILVTSSDKWHEPVLLLTKEDIEKLKEAWKEDIR